VTAPHRRPLIPTPAFRHIMQTPADRAIQSRRTFLVTMAGGLTGMGVLAPLATLHGQPNAAQPRPATLPAGVPRTITVYKDPNCGCCTAWVKHLQMSGFAVTAHDTSDMATVKASMGVPKSLESCHTARVGSYAIEGHVPADVIVKLLQLKPAGLGLAVPGMPIGSPGMEGTPVDRYDIMLFDKSGKSRVFASR